MLIAAAVCPHPPLLVPRLAGGAAPELDSVRTACDRAVAALVAARPDRLLVVGAGGRTARHPGGAAGSLAPYGAPIAVGAGPAVLPLSLTVGRWLVERAGAEPAGFAELAGDARPEECLVVGAELAASAPRVAVLVMGDGSARRGERSPGRFDERAVDFDDAVAAALAGADLATLATLDPVLAEQLMAAGRPAWQALAGAAEGAGLSAERLAYEAPYGVGYFVTLWR
ncbi:class III extradiol ring-cleavage dioxygenase family protein [Marinitenerispora sediminis]|uniref:Extradiol ring-cleavage dioxygenase class III enzyme subunit B domain-containing protein n=1 Tax=Marinitenerispora sediminis TaxID=1931232 RepID=A0A368T3U3_9ACTN|nr:hypothetical protein [Marinitenerispora sediminis]RCV49090.1 hypothetical protein DEF28_21845 [Marinitenerispora sediminis]RCV49270.1 hypothetical protein DEF23_23865 [Marinitenerispora sediminis]RCV52392.1 hypothetical protein DEF24_22075 [Marinitenerispora sediminis]